jgi:ribosomal protein S8
VRTQVLARFKNKKFLTVELKYDGQIPAIAGIKRVSKQGQRIYTGYREMRAVKGGKGF